MLSNDPTQPQVSSSQCATPGTSGTPAKVLDPRDVIEVASTGGGTVSDPSGTDNKPPGACDQDFLHLA